MSKNRSARHRKSRANGRTSRTTPSKAERLEVVEGLTLDGQPFARFYLDGEQVGMAYGCNDPNCTEGHL